MRRLALSIPAAFVAVLALGLALLPLVAPGALAQSTPRWARSIERSLERGRLRTDGEPRRASEWLGLLAEEGNCSIVLDRRAVSTEAADPEVPVAAGRTRLADVLDAVLDATGWTRAWSCGTIVVTSPDLAGRFPTSPPDGGGIDRDLERLLSRRTLDGLTIDGTFDLARLREVLASECDLGEVYRTPEAVAAGSASPIVQADLRLGRAKADEVLTLAAALFDLSFVCADGAIWLVPLRARDDLDPASIETDSVPVADLPGGVDFGTTAPVRRAELSSRHGRMRLLHRIGDRRMRHGGERVLDVVVDPTEGRWIASIGHDRWVRIWDAKTGAERRSVRLHMGEHSPLVGNGFLAAHPDGRRLFVAGNWPGADLREIDVETGAVVREIDLSDVIDDLAVAPDGSWLAVATDGGVVVYEDGSTRIAHRLDGYARTLGVSPDGSRLYGGGVNGYVRAWRMPDGRRAGGEQISRVTIHTLAVSPDGRFLATGDDDGHVRLWSAENLEHLRVVGTQANIGQFGFSNEAAGERPGESDPSRDGEATTVQKVRQLRLYSVVFSRDGRWIVSDRNYSSPIAWDARAEHRVFGRQYARIQGNVRCLAVAPQGWIAAGCDDGMVRIWNLEADGEDAVTPVARFETSEPHAAGPNPASEAFRGPIDHLSVDPRGRRAVASSRSMWARDETWLFDVASRRGRRLDLGRGDWVDGLRIDPTGAKLLVRGKGGVDLFDARSGEPLARRVFERRASSLKELLAIRPDLGRAITGPRANDDGGSDLHVWDVDTGRHLFAISSFPVPGGRHQNDLAVDYSGDGRLLAVAHVGLQGVEIRDADTGRLAKTIEIPGEDDDLGTIARTVRFSPDGRTVALGGYADRVYLLDVKTGELLRRLIVHPFRLQALAYSPDGAWLATGGRDGKLHVYGTDGVELDAIEVDGLVRSIAFAGDEIWVGTGSGTIAVLAFRP